MQATFSMQDQCATLRLDGRFDLYAHRAFNDACLMLHAHQDIKSIALDFSALNYMDSSGLGMLLVLHSTVEARAIPIHILHCQAHIRRILGYANFNQLFQIMPD